MNELNAAVLAAMVQAYLEDKGKGLREVVEVQGCECVGVVAGDRRGAGGGVERPPPARKDRLHLASQEGQATTSSVNHDTQDMLSRLRNNKCGFQSKALSS